MIGGSGATNGACRLRVKLDKTQGEHNASAFGCIATKPRPVGARLADCRAESSNLHQ
jgi:hypothetical protein